jgi:DNA-binding CsgD family transcriptional regulator
VGAHNGRGGVPQMNGTLKVTKRENPEEIVRLVSEYLSSGPSPDEFCQWLVTQWLADLGANGSLLHVVRKTGSLALIGSFGYPIDQVETFKSVSLKEPLPISDAARDREPVIVNGAAEVAERYPHLSDYFRETPEASLVVHPIESKNNCKGVIGVDFSSNLSKEMYTATTLPLIASLLSVYMTDAFRGSFSSIIQQVSSDGSVETQLGVIGWVADSPQGTPGGSQQQTNAKVDSNALGEPLTDRQLQILHLMADGKTNPLIAYMLGYSESTVRHESMRIFKKLGAASRSEAVQIGKQRGFVTPA